MATDRERNKAFRRERVKRDRVRTAIQRDTVGEVLRLLGVAQDDIRQRLAAAPSEFDSFLLPRLQDQIQRALDELRRGASERLTMAAGQSWQAGIDLIEKPIEAGLALGDGPRVILSSILPTVDTRPLLAMRTFMTGRIEDITATLANRINTELGLVLIGAQSPSQAVGKVADIMRLNARTRAVTIVRTELGRAFSAAGQQRYSQAQQILPGLKKQWRRSGKRHSRADHDLADGQVQEVDKPFRVGGINLMFPRDPKAPAKHTINCGCSSLPIMESWEVSQPGQQPFTEEELAVSRFRRDLEGAKR